MDDEVFSFNLSLTPKATEGDGYTDTSKVDGKVRLNVGCIQVVYLQKFVMTLVVSFSLKHTHTLIGYTNSNQVPLILIILEFIHVRNLVIAFKWPRRL